MTPFAPARATFTPRLSLETLTRGDGLLGLRGSGKIGPRGGQATVAAIDWLYTLGDHRWQTPAPRSVMGGRPEAVVVLPAAWGDEVVIERDLAAEADALDLIRTLGLQPLPPEALQWRAKQVAEGHDDLWTLPLENLFGDFWADAVPRLRSQGWRVVVKHGFAHETMAVDGWKIVVAPETGEVLGREVAGPMRAAEVMDARGIRPLGQPHDRGSWLLSLGVEVAGEALDLVPMLADLLQRDRRWLDAQEVAAMDDRAIVMLRAPNGRRIEAPAAPLKAIVGAMVDLLTDALRHKGPLKLSAWDAGRLDLLALDLLESQAARAGPHGRWQLQGDAGLSALAERLKEAGSPQAIEAPPGLGLTLRAYQLEGIAWLQYLREQQLAGILADDMGLGKTAQALAHLLIEKQAGRLELPALVVLPTSLVFNWLAEASRIAPALRLLALQGPDRAARFSAMADHDVVLTTYPLLWRDIDALKAQPFHLLILDEAQVVKNVAGRSARALRELRARHRLCLTGTPLENHLGELWAQFDFLMPGFLGDARRFKRVWRDPIEKNGETLRAQALGNRVRPFILRRRKDEVATELPPRTEVIERLPLEGRQRALYESVRVACDKQVRKVLKDSGFNGAQLVILEALLRLRQVCCDPLLLKHERMSPDIERAKIEWLQRTMPELMAEGRRVLVFSQFTQMLALIATELQALALPHLALTGDTPPAQRGEVVRSFQAREVPILLASLKAGGLGLNLTAADTVIHVDPWWNPAVEQQATDRAHRIGQTQPVFVYKLVIAGSIEERILELQQRKRALAEGVLGRDAEGAVKFGESDLEGLLAPLG